MSDGVSERSITLALDLIYDAALDPTSWPAVLEQMARLFDSHFADLFTRSHDRSQYTGLAFGLDRADYQDLFLDTWFKRNVWGISKPVKVSGEVLSTRQMVAIADLTRSEIYADYLDPRGLHEGMRLSIWADERGIQDISLLRPWSAGAFESKEIALGETLLPHLQRAAKVAQRLQHAEATREAGLVGLAAAGFALMLLDPAGRPVFLNAAAETMVRERDGLSIRGSELHAATSAANSALRRGIAMGLHVDGLRRTSSTVRLPRPSGAVPLVLVTLPLRDAAGVAAFGGPALLVLVTDPHASTPTAVQLAGLFDLTDAEADLAEQLLAGHDLREIATRRGRSIHTVRNHLARLMEKTETARQAELINRLRSIPALPSLVRPSG